MSIRAAWEAASAAVSRSVWSGSSNPRRTILAFAFFYTITIATLALAVAMCGVDWITSLTGAAAMVSGVGPGMGEMVGPAGNYAGIPDLAKWLLTLGMLLGRLEILTVLVLLFPAFWRH